MSLFTTLTRNWLTRSLQPFAFKNEYDNQLEFEQEDKLGLYVHIPFCRQLCNFCPYCKQLYDATVCNEYLDYLIREIHMVGSRLTQKKQVTSLYFGGGTPALAAARIGEIILALQQYFIITEGVGVELYPDNVNEETLTILRSAGVSKISIGIQSFGDKFLDLLGRKNFEMKQIAAALQKVHFDTVSMDFIFALPNQTFEDLKSDMEAAFSIGANHVAIYPFIDFTFTDSTVRTMAKREKRKLLDDITLYCRSKGYTRDSIWTFSNVPEAKYSSMTRENFLGFGCSATTLLRNQFKINTFSVAEYQRRIAGNNLPTSLTLRFTKRQRMIYYLFWTAYSTQVDAKAFENFFGEKLQKCYGFELWAAKKLGFITEENEIFHMTLKGAFYYHYYENFYTLSYIDKMWSVMRNHAFPEELRL
ncbi:MAG: radical SAM protein [Clostridiaceae bacterium]|nr:radical SAM protein [Clostridiaceae bacterium]